MARAFFRLLVYVFIFYLVYLVIRIFRAATKPRNTPPPQVQGVMVKDEICNTYVPKEAALREVFKGEEHFFCSEECRHKFHEKLRAR